MKPHNLFTSLIILSLIVLPGLATAVNVTFSEPVIIDSSRQSIVPAGRFLEIPNGINSLQVFPGPAYDLIMAGMTEYGGYSLMRVDYEGNLIDTLPAYIPDFISKYPTPLPNDTVRYAVKTAIWSDPYWYILLTRYNTLFYCRATNDLEFIDISPVELMPQPTQLIVDGEYLWTTRRDGATGKYFANRFLLPDPTPLMADVELPDYFANTSLICGQDGLFFVRNNYSYTQFLAAYLSPDGTLLKHDTLVYAPTGMSRDIRLLSWNADSALCVWMTQPNDTALFTLGYFFVISGENPAPIHLDTIGLVNPIPNYPLLLKGAFTHDSLAFLVYLCSHNTANCYVIQFDPMNGVVVSDDLYAGGHDFVMSSYTDCRIHTSKAIYTYTHSVYAHGTDLMIGTFDMQAPFQGDSPEPILFHTEYQTRPTLIADTGGVLVYAEHAGDSSLDIHGYYIPCADYPLVSADFNVFTYDTSNFFPRLYAVDDHRAFFWANYDHFEYYYGRFVLFDGLFPSPERIADNSYPLTRMARTRAPSFRRSDSLLYINQVYGTSLNGEAYVSYLVSGLYTYDLNNDLMLPDNIRVFSVGDNALIPVGDSIVVLRPYNECLDDGPTYCREYSCGYRGFTVFVDTMVQRDRSYVDIQFGCNSWQQSGGFDYYIRGSVFEIEGECLITYDDSYVLRQMDYADQDLVDVVDVETASGIDFYPPRYPYLINPVETDQAIAVFMINTKNYLLNRLLVFTKDWEYIGQTLLPTIGSVKDFSEFQYSQETNTIYFAYSAYFGKPFSSTRIVLQSVSLDNVTDVDNNGAADLPRFSLSQNSPNPFNASTKIRFSLPRQSDVTLAVYNILGQKVVTLIDGNLPAGDHEIIWNGLDSRGKAVATGIYLYKITADGKEITKKMMLLK